MSKIFLKSATNDLTIERELKKSETIIDIRRYLSQHLNIDMVNIKIVFNGKIVIDTIPLDHLKKNGNLTLDFIVKNQKINTEDIEMKVIGTRISVKLIYNGSKRLVDPKNVIVYKDRLLLIKKRERRVNHLEELQEMVKKIKKEVIIKIVIIIAMFMTNNHEFGIIFIVMLILRFINNLKIRVKMNNISGFGLVYKSILAFFISMFMLNSDQILDFKSD